jgi:vitamin B12 transporter
MRASALLLATLTSLSLALASLEARAQEEPPPAPDEVQPDADDQDRREARPTFQEQIVVTAGRTEQKLGNLPVHATVLTSEELRRSPAQTVADVLMQVPAFTMTKSSSSRVASPSNTPAALRSLGGSSASRTLVLVDGVPLNDPFFGWIPWSRVSRSSVERIEVVPTGGAGAWGNQALGGVINVVTRRPETTGVALDARLGSLDTVDLDLSGSYARGPVSFSPRVTYFDTDGYVELGEEYRGPVITKSSSDNYLLDGRFEYNPGPGSRWVLQGSYLSDDREGSTSLNLDHAELLSVSAGADLSEVAGGSLRLNAFGQWRSGWSTRGSVNSSLTAVTPNRDQFDIPSSGFGVGAGWVRPLSAQHLLSGGADAQWTEGDVHEDSRYVAGRFTRRGVTGGRQFLVGVYGQDTAVLGTRWRAVAGARLDFWRSSDGLNFQEDLTSGAVLNDVSFPSREVWTLNPNLGLLFRATGRLGLRASVYRGFRAPTPNELFRSVVTGSRNFNQANENLEPERITVGFETGFDYAVSNSVSLRATGFWNEVDDAINDVTVGSAGRTPEEIPPCGLVPAGGSCRQKQNLERVRNRGTELELRLAPHRSVSFAAAYTYGYSTVLRAPNAPQLVGNRLRRTPRHQATLRAEYANRRILTASLLGRYNGDRYQDDQNTFLIDDSFVVDLSVSRRFGDRLELYSIAENLLNTAFEVDNSGDGIEYGHSRLLQVGLRFAWRDGGTKGRGR